MARQRARASMRLLLPNRTGIARPSQRDASRPTFVQVKGTIVPDGASRLQRLSAGGGRRRPKPFWEQTLAGGEVSEFRGRE